MRALSKTVPPLLLYGIHKTLPVAVTELTVINIFDQISFQYITTNKAKDKTVH